MFKTRIAAAGLCAFALSSSAVAATISGAGATFPAPVYAKWAEEYQAATSNRVNYQPIGSGGGIKQIQSRTVDFGATDKPLSGEELAKAELVQFPTLVGGVVMVVNVPGIESGQLRLTGPLISDIYRGIIKRWNHPLLARMNPGVKLPNLPITVVHRSDGSGTTFLFTTYLAKVAQNWAKDVGANDSVRWPTGIGGKGNNGVAAYVRQTIGSIGYVESAFAKQNNLTWTQMRNKERQFVEPTPESFAAAAAGSDWEGAPGFGVLPLDQPGAQSWPITGATFILLPTRPANVASARETLNFFDWAFTNGDKATSDLDYVPLPAPVKQLIRASWSNVTGSDNKPVR